MVASPLRPAAWLLATRSLGARRYGLLGGRHRRRTSAPRRSASGFQSLPSAASISPRTAATVTRSAAVMTRLCPPLAIGAHLARRLDQHRGLGLLGSRGWLTLTRPAVSLMTCTGVFSLPVGRQLQLDRTSELVLRVLRERQHRTAGQGARTRRAAASALGRRLAFAQADDDTTQHDSAASRTLS